MIKIRSVIVFLKVMEQQSITYFFPITARVASAKPCLEIDTPDAMHTRKKKVFLQWK